MTYYTVNDMCTAGCTSRRGIRYWETEGLLGIVGRSAGGTRQYTVDQLDRARIIAAAQFGGWSLDKTKEMIAEWGPEVRTALIARLIDQSKAALKLAENLPAVDGLIEYDMDVVPQEYDL